MSEFSRVRLYIFVLTALAVGAVLISITDLDGRVMDWLVVLVIGIVIVILDAFPVGPFLGRIEMTISEIVKFASVLILRPPVLIVAIAFGVLVAEVRIERPWYRKLFNISAITVTWVVVAWVYQSLVQTPLDYFGSIQNILAWVVAGLSEFLFNAVLVCLAIALASRLSFAHVWQKTASQVVWPGLSMIALGIFVAILWNYNPLSVALIVLPALGLRYSYRIVERLERQTTEALSALTQVIDERDENTSQHSEQVSKYAKKLATQFDLPEQEIETIANAALLHDLGKVGMKDDILFGSKLLSPEERHSAEKHAEMGAMLLSKFPLFKQGARLVRYHHERYDGKGYPDRLKGEGIPLGARIIAVCDAYQAMTENRPYRRALTPDLAIEQIRQGSGTQFDPQVVEAFIRILTTDAARESPASRANPTTARA